jgi:hypothetical protein
MIRDKVSAHRSQLEPALLMRHAKEDEHRRAEWAHSPAVSGEVAKRKVHESLFAADRSAAGNCHLKCENPRPYWSSRVQMLNRRT